MKGDNMQDRVEGLPIHHHRDGTHSVTCAICRYRSTRFPERGRARAAAVQHALGTRHRRLQAYGVVV